MNKLKVIGNGLTGNMVGRIAKQIGLKAEKPGQNGYITRMDSMLLEMTGEKESRWKLCRV